jgi:cytidylate kinase
MMASAVSAKSEVRAFLLEMQRKLARENNVLMDGRDIGTVVLPNATVKIFLTASAEERAQRRYDELVLKGMKVTFEEVYDDMVKRDYADSHREIAPLKQAEDAILADTTGLEPEQSLALILKIVKDRI